MLERMYNDVKENNKAPENEEWVSFRQEHIHKYLGIYLKSEFLHINTYIYKYIQ